MKTINLGIITAMLFFSCTKQNTPYVFEPIAPAVANDPNFRVSSFSAQQTANQIRVSFTTSLEKDITEVVLMHGSNTTQFCSVNRVEKEGDAHFAGTYNIVDDKPQGPITYYVVKYTTKSGDWGCSELYQSTSKAQ
jgi:hypothetical protein